MTLLLSSPFLLSRTLLTRQRQKQGKPSLPPAEPASRVGNRWSGQDPRGLAGGRRAGSAPCPGPGCPQHPLRVSLEMTVVQAGIAVCGFRPCDSRGKDVTFAATWHPFLSFFSLQKSVFSLVVKEGRNGAGETGFSSLQAWLPRRHRPRQDGGGGGAAVPTGAKGGAGVAVRPLQRPLCSCPAGARRSSPDAGRGAGPAGARASARPRTLATARPGPTTWPLASPVCEVGRGRPRKPRTPRGSLVKNL